MTKKRNCAGPTRRDFVRSGGLTAFGLGLAPFLRLRAAAGERPAKAKSCILVWLAGGPSHLDSFDPKPDAPEEVRGPFAAIPTRLAGVRVGECLPLTARMIDKFAVVRSVTSPLGEHNFGTHYLMTGHKPSPALAYPTFGATVAHVREAGGVLPANMAVPSFPDQVSANGYLPGTARPFAVPGDPRTGNFRVRDLDFYRGLDLERLGRRREFVNAMDRFARSKDAGAGDTADPDLARAYALLASPKAKRAFDLTREPTALRQRYGFGNNLGQSCLLARRLVESGVPFVTVHGTGWDTHANIMNLKQRYPGDRNAMLPSLDRAVTALVGDLADRGMLGETLVVVMGEFGRTPKVNANAGRDHWPNVFSVALAGGGVRGGRVVGSSDAVGAFPKDNAVTPADLAATVYTLLGIDPAGELHTADGRPVRVAPDGSQAIRGVLA